MGSAVQEVTLKSRPPPVELVGLPSQGSPPVDVHVNTILETRVISIYQDVYIYIYQTMLYYNVTKWSFFLSSLIQPVHVSWSCSLVKHKPLTDIYSVETESVLVTVWSTWCWWFRGLEPGYFPVCVGNKALLYSCQVAPSATFASPPSHGLRTVTVVAYIMYNHQKGRPFIGFWSWVDNMYSMCHIPLGLTWVMWSSDSKDPGSMNVTD